MPLNSKRRQALKAKAHSLKPTVMTGNNGLTEAVLNEIDIALTAHELIKIKLVTERDERKKWITEICEKLQAEPVQLIGQIAVLFRHNPESK